MEEDLRAMACEQVRHNRPAIWHRVPAAGLPCCTGVADVHGVNGLQCSHEDENTRVVCMKAGDGRLRSSGQPKPSAAVEYMFGGMHLQGALQTHLPSNGLQLHGSGHHAARVEAR